MKSGLVWCYGREWIKCWGGLRPLSVVSGTNEVIVWGDTTDVDRHGEGYGGFLWKSRDVVRCVNPLVTVWAAMVLTYLGYNLNSVVDGWKVKCDEMLNKAWIGFVF